MSDEFLVYQTFNCNIPKTNVSSIQIQTLIKSVASFDTHHKCVMVQLIIEHAKLNGDLPTDLQVPPYSGVCKDNSVDFVLNNLPHPLKWILLRYVLMVTKDS